MKLEGIRVLDLSLFLPGPLLTQMMADHGAEVIKLEPINGGEPNRVIGAIRDGTTVFFANPVSDRRYCLTITLNIQRMFTGIVTHVQMQNGNSGVQ